MVSRSGQSMFQEKIVKGLPGWLMLAVLIGLLVLAFAVPVNAAVSTALCLLAAFGFAGLTVVNPNEAKVVVLFGTYRGTVKAPGFWWFIPLARRRRVSLRVRNF